MLRSEKKSEGGILEKLRYMAREVVLPVSDLKVSIMAAISGREFNNPVLDFGAGTLFWADWFVSDLGANVCAVDPLLLKYNIMPKTNKISIYSSLESCLARHDRFEFIWCCDVLHHIEKKDTSAILKLLSEKANMILIKDIASESLWGSTQNFIHDFVFNWQIVRGISSIELSDEMKTLGFRDIKMLRLSKLGYSHFVLIAKK